MELHTTLQHGVAAGETAVTFHLNLNQSAFCSRQPHLHYLLVSLLYFFHCLHCINRQRSWRSRSWQRWSARSNISAASHCVYGEAGAVGAAAGSAGEEPLRYSHVRVSYVPRFPAIAICFLFLVIVIFSGCCLLFGPCTCSTRLSGLMLW